MKKLLTLLAALVLVLSLSACKTEVVEEVNTDPVLAGVTDVNLTIGATFNELEGVTATDAEDGTLTASITVSGTVDLDMAGTYTVTYSVTDEDDATVTASRTVTVSEIDVVYPTGFFNYKFAKTELRHTFMAAAEKYLMNNMYAGIPLFANGGFNLYSSRLQLPVDEYVAVMGYGTMFATMSADDSTVIMDDGAAGEVGKYTYRTTVSTNPGTFNQWLYDTSTDSDLMGGYFDALYVYEFNADKSGYSVNPSMAAAAPTPVSPTVTETGKEVAKTWQITLRDDLVWKYHPDTDISGLPTGHATIDANDFVDTYKLALEQQWFRAVSGGGDFLNEATAIKNAQEFVDGTKDWSEVGIKKIDDLTFEFTFNNDMSDWNVRYWLSSFVMTPVNTEMYDMYEAALTGEETNPYGTNNKNMAYHGGYYVDYYEADKILRYEENDMYHSPDDFFYDAFTYSVIEDATVVFQEFVDGKLEGTSLPTAEFENYKNHPGLKMVPGATTYRIMINGTGTLENLNTIFPDATWVPEPLLANQDFKMAMYHALDRGTLATDILKTRTENMFLFTPAYLVDAELGVPYRSTEQGISVGEGLSPSTLGYNFDAARAYYLKAVTAGIAAGEIVAGTEAAPTLINIELNNYANSESWDLACEYIKTAYEAAFQDDTNHVNVTISIHTKDFPGIYYDYMMVGEFDLSVGGISGSTLDAASFLDTYSSDDRGGFTLNWGIDTSIAEIPVVYYDFEGMRHNEMWSFDAIGSALNGEIYLSMGEETDAPAAKDIEVTPTTVSFTIDQYDNTDYNNITYTMQWYDNDNGVYVDVAGKVKVATTEADIVVEGLLPFYYGYTEMGTLLYQGDYQIVIEYGYVLDAEKEGMQISTWFEMGVPFDLVTDSKVATMTSVVFGMTINVEDVATRTLTSLAVYTADAADVYTMNATAVVDITDLTAVSVTGLAVGSTNRGLLTFSDGTIYWISLMTDDVAELAADVVADMTAELSVVVATDNTATVTSVIVYLKSDDSVVGTVDMTDLTKILVTGLTAETAYYFEVVFSDMEERMVEFTTTATPAA